LSLQEDFVQSVKSGLIEPLVVRLTPKSKASHQNYEVVAGHRRFKAVQQLKIDPVPCEVYEMDDKEALLLAVRENIDRKDLNPMELARAYVRMKEEHKMSEGEIADQFNKSQQSVSQYIRIHEDDQLRSAVKNGLAITYAQELVSLAPSKDRLHLIVRLRNGELSSKKLREEVAALKAKQNGDSEPGREQRCGLCHKEYDNRFLSFFLICASCEEQTIQPWRKSHQGDGQEA
jgi:ParB family chromosome partitioning protein